MKKGICMTLALSLWLCGAALAEQIVVVHKSVAVDALDGDTLQKIYLGKKTNWDSGERIVPVTLNEGPVHEAFFNTVVKKSVAQYLTYWKQMIFTGQGVPPKSLMTEAEVVSFVSGTAGAVGYIDSATPHDAVKAVAVK